MICLKFKSEIQTSNTRMSTGDPTLVRQTKTYAELLKTNV